MGESMWAQLCADIENLAEREISATQWHCHGLLHDGSSRLWREIIQICPNLSDLYNIIFRAFPFFVFSTQRRRGAEALEIMRGREGIAIDALA